MNNSKHATLVVMAAGMGSRYGGVKQLDSFGPDGEIIMDYSIFDAIKAGFDKVVVIIRKDIEADFRSRLFDRIAKNFDAEYVFQQHESLLTPQQIADSTGREKPWGTAIGPWQASGTGFTMTRSGASPCTTSGRCSSI